MKIVTTEILGLSHTYRFVRNTRAFRIRYNTAGSWISHHGAIKITLYKTLKSDLGQFCIATSLTHRTTELKHKSRKVGKSRMWILLTCCFNLVNCIYLWHFVAGLSLNLHFGCYLAISQKKHEVFLVILLRRMGSHHLIITWWYNQMRKSTTLVQETITHGIIEWYWLDEHSSCRLFGKNKNSACIYLAPLQ